MYLPPTFIIKLDTNENESLYKTTNKVEFPNIPLRKFEIHLYLGLWDTSFKNPFSLNRDVKEMCWKDYLEKNWDTKGQLWSLDKF